MITRGNSLSDRVTNQPARSHTLSSRAMDALADVLDLARVSGSVLAHVNAQGVWGLDLHPDFAAFHAVTAGSIWLQVDGSEPTQLMPGDLVLLPGGTRHQLLS